MDQIYIVVMNGRVTYVSTDSAEVIKNIGVTVIDLDTNGDSKTSPEDIEKADSLTRIW